MPNGIKYLKIQQEIMKNADKAHFQHIQRWMIIDWDVQPDTIGVSEGHFIMFIPKNFFYLDQNCFGRHFDGSTVIKYKHPDDGFTVKETNKLIKAVNHTNSGKSRKGVVLHKFHIPNAEGENIYIDENILSKYFELSDPVQLTATGKKEPLYIWDKETLAGLILPVNHSEGGEE